MMNNFLNIKNISIIVILCVGFFVGGFYLGNHDFSSISKIITIENKEIAVETKADFEPFWKVWNIINKKYPDATKIDDQKRVYGAISGLVSSLDDPYSTYFTPDEAKAFKEDISGSFSGVGMEIGIKDKIPTVIAPLKGTPAYNAGIKSGDKILKIDGKSTGELKIDQIIKLIRGEKGTTVTLVIYREEDKEPREIKIVRDTINIPNIETELRKDGIFVISLYTFSATSADLFRNAIKEFASSGSDKLVLDLRDNPGGYLESSVDIASWFLPKGKLIVKEDYGNDIPSNEYTSYGYDLFSDKLKFVILINNGSASASEILAGAMQDYKKALLVGEQSFGKGSVQEVVNVTKDTFVKITVAKWLTPLEHHIHGTGLTPDYKVPFTRADADAKKDPQLDKAVELLNNWPK
ncbi:MAG: S41 family peptidase [bacterium]|nr:S41 family peptidase [bacterium]